MLLAKPQDVLSYVVDPQELAPELREVKDYWLAKRGTRKLPRRADIEPVELRRHLPYLSLVEVLGDAEDFRFRLLGTEITHVLQRDSTGKTVREIYAQAEPEALNWMLEVYRIAATRQCPVLRRGTLRVIHKDYIAFESLHLPLSDDGDRVNMFLGRMRFITGERKAGA